MDSSHPVYIIAMVEQMPREKKLVRSWVRFPPGAGLYLSLSGASLVMSLNEMRHSWFFFQRWMLSCAAWCIRSLIRETYAKKILMASFELPSIRTFSFRTKDSAPLKFEIAAATVVKKKSNLFPNREAPLSPPSVKKMQKITFLL